MELVQFHGSGLVQPLFRIGQIIVDRVRSQEKRIYNKIKCAPN